MMLGIALILLTAIQPVAQTATQDEVKDALVHAEALYYGARFRESIALLTRVDDSLKIQPGRLQDKINTKLRLALAYIGMNDTAKAKSLLIDLYTLDPNYVLDPQQFSPKVMAVANEAKTDQTKVQCQAAQTDAKAYLENGKNAALLDLMRSMKRKCTALAAMEPEAADSLYKTGMLAYKRGEFGTALANFEAAVALAPQHELALQYIDLIQSKQQVNQDRLLLQWQREFDARQLPAAAADYRQIVASSNGRTTAQVTHVTTEYRKALMTLVETWNRTCPSGDAAAMNAIRGQISDLLPEPSFGADIRAQMTVCEPTKTASTTTEVRTETIANVTPGPSIASCLEMQPQLVLARLKTRVDPVITNDIRYYLKNNPEMSVRVKAKISEAGDVTVISIQESNPILNSSIRNALVQWKFTPIRDQNGPRCVETEIPILIKLAR
jgi:tetratricopeptide (TPR) repeat protein